MSADEMFEKLGYKKKEIKDKWNKVWGISYKNKKKWIEINIDYTDAEICIGTIGDDYSYGEAVYISMQELKVINKKCKELGWLEEVE